VKTFKYPKDFHLAKVWFHAFNCSFSELDCVIWENCPENASLEWLPGYFFDVTLTEESYNIYNAVYAVTQALHEMFLHQIEAQPMEYGKDMVFSSFTGNAFFINGLQWGQSYGLMGFYRKSN
jgi:vomeronasal 2 receptor